jgi:sacsin
MLSDLGLRSSVNDPDTFLMCAEKIASYDANDVSVTVIDNANNLIRYLWSNLNTFLLPNTSTFYSKLTEIAFVPVPVPAITNPYTFGRMSLKRFKDCAIKDDFYLCWTNTPILSDSTMPPSTMWKRLDILHPPSPKAVVEHILAITQDESGGGLMERWPFKDDDITSVFQKIYSHLQSSWKGVYEGTSLGSALKSRPFVPLESRLVKPSRLFFRLQYNLSPFMFEIPRVFGAYDTLFQALGAKEVATDSHFVSFLHELYNETGEGAAMLNPNENEAVLKVIGLLATSTESSRKMRLYIPNVKGYLVSDLKCYYNDAPWLAERIDSGEIHFANDKIALSQADRLGIRRLSQCVFEELCTYEDIPLGTVLSELGGMEYPATLTFDRKTLMDVIGRIILHQTPLNDIASAPLPPPFEDCTAIEMEIVLRHLQRLFGGTSVTSIQVKFVKKINCKYFLRNSQGQKKDVTSASYENLFYMSSDKADGVVILNATKLRVCKVQPHEAVALAINQQVGFILQNLLPLTMVIKLLMAPSSHTDISPSPENTAVETILASCGFIGQEELVAVFRSLPGKRLLAADEGMLQLMPLRGFVTGEIVAYSDDNSVFKYGIIKADVTPKAGLLDSRSFDLKQFEVQVDKHRVRVMASTQIYSFTTVSQRGSGSNKSFNKGGHGTSTGLLTYSTPEIAIPTMIPSSVVVTGGKEATVKGETLSDVVVGSGASGIHPSFTTGPSISSSHILHAVNDILSRANLSLDSSVTSLMEQNISLRNEIKSGGDENVKMRKEIDTLSTEIERIKSSFNCEICFNKTSDRILIPCGHLLCSNCAAQLQRRVCPFDRQTFTSVVEFRIPFG